MKKRLMKLMAIGCLASIFITTDFTQAATNNGAVDAGVISAISSYMSKDAVQVVSSGVNTVTAGMEGGVSAGAASEVTLASQQETQPQEAQQSVEEVQAAPQETICGYTNLGIAKVDSTLNVRAEADEASDIVGKMPKDAGCEIVQNIGDWYEIQSGNVHGFVKAEYLMSGDEAKARASEIMSVVATVTTQTLYVREQPNTECTILSLMPMGEELQVLEDLGDWVKIDLDGDEGYVSKEYVSLSSELQKAMTMTEVKYGQGVSDVRVSLVSYATQFVGNPYVWGGTSLTKGADCSGFVLSVFAKYGISLPHHAASQAGCGTKISASEAQPGDLFFYGNGRGINHVAIYIGNGQVVHASSPKTGIKISNCSYRNPVRVVRVLN